jgi:hypothetical protein
MPKFLNNIQLISAYMDFGQNEARNCRVHNLASAPSSPVTGQMYFDTTLDNFGVRASSVWLYFYANTTTLNNITAPNGPVSLNSQKITNLATPTAGTDGVNKNYVDSNFYTNTTTLNNITAPSGNLSLNNFKITNLATPTTASDAVTKSYADGLVSGLSWKQEVRAATTTNGTLASAFANGSVIDGVTLATGDRILLKNQTTQSQNGIYIVQASGAPVRATDADTDAKLLNAAVFVSEGTANADTAWVGTADAPITVDTTALPFVQFSSSATLSFSGGLTQSGTNVTVSTGQGITVTSGAVTAKLNSAGALSKDNGTGTDELAVNVDGTTVTISSNQLTVVKSSGVTSGYAGIAQKFIGSITGNGSTTTFTITHNLNTKDIHVAVRGTSSPNTDTQVYTDINPNNVNSVDIVFATAPASGVNFAVTVIG